MGEASGESKVRDSEGGVARDALVGGTSTDDNTGLDMATE